MLATNPILAPKAYEPKTVAEQSAFEFGQRIRQLRLGINAENLIAAKYAFTHQYSAFPRSDNGYERLKAAFNAGAGIDYTASS